MQKFDLPSNCVLCRPFDSIVHEFHKPYSMDKLFCNLLLVDLHFRRPYVAEEEIEIMKRKSSLEKGKCKIVLSFCSE